MSTLIAAPLAAAAQGGSCTNGTDDSFEPNQSCAAAPLISLASLDDLVVTGTNPDYYKILVPAGRDFEASTSGLGVQFSIYDENCSLVSGSGAWENTFTTPKEFFVKVESTTGGCVDYDLDFFTSCFVGSEEFEDNDTIATAAPLSDGSYLGLSVIVGDDDFYSLCVAPGATLRMDMNYLDLLAWARIELINAPGHTQNNSNLGMGSVVFTNQTTATVTVIAHISVSFAMPYDCTPYDLGVLGSIPCPGTNTTTFCDPAMPNSTGQSTAMTASFGSSAGSGLHIECTSGPPGQFAYVLMGSSFSEPGLPFGQGFFCLSTAPGNLIARYNVSGGSLNSTGFFDASGVLTNLSGTSTIGTGFDVPTLIPNGGQMIFASESWSFQLWHRDLMGQSNFSNGVTATF